MIGRMSEEDMRASSEAADVVLVGCEGEDHAPPGSDGRRRFRDLLSRSLEAGTPLKLVLSRYQGKEPDLQRVQARSLVIRGERCLSFVYRYRSRDITENLPSSQALRRVDELLDGGFRQANLLASGVDTQLGISKRGKLLFRTTTAVGDAASETPAADPGTEAPSHNREKRRLLSLERPFLQALGVTDSQRQLIPSMARRREPSRCIRRLTKTPTSSSP